MIEGVQVKKLRVIPDERGRLMEILRADDDIFLGFGQVYLTTKSIIDTSPDLVLRFCKAMKASVDELLSQPLAPIFERAARDFDIPGLTDMDKAVATQQATAKVLWLADGRENLLRNVPRRWVAGVATLRDEGVTGIPDPTALYTNQFIDAALKA